MVDLALGSGRLVIYAALGLAALWWGMLDQPARDRIWAEVVAIERQVEAGAAPRALDGPLPPAEHALGDAAQRGGP